MSSLPQSLDTSQLISKSRYSDNTHLRDSQLKEETWWHKMFCCIEIGYKEQIITWQHTILGNLDQRQRKPPWRRHIRRLITTKSSQQLDQLREDELTEFVAHIKDFDIKRSGIYGKSELSDEKEDRPGSIMDFRIQLLDNEKQYYKYIIKFMQNQMESISFLGMLFKGFVDYYLQLEYQLTYRTSIRTDRHQQYVKQSIEFCDHIKDFVDFFVQTMYMYFLFEELIKDPLLKCFTLTNMSSFTLTMLFREEQIYLKVLQIFSEIYYDENKKYFSKILSLNDKNPSFFGVPSQFELQESLERNMVLGTNVSIQRNWEEHQIPYFKSIETLKKIQFKKSPSHQLKVICKCIDSISKCIDQFCHRNNRKPENFGIDELIPILSYIVVRAQIQNLQIFLMIIETFSPKNTLNSKAGYNLITLQQSIVSLQQFDKQQEIRTMICKSQMITYRIPSQQEIRSNSFNVEY